MRFLEARRAVFWGSNSLEEAELQKWGLVSL